MIDVRELRVGNLLYNERTVVTIDARSIFDIWDKSEKYEPIPLSQSWLKRFGFEIAENSYFKGVFNIWVNNICIHQDTFDVTVFSLYNYNDTKVYIQYIHQLQNIFFALRGEEITIQ
jgi:hypothetical protein